MQNQVIAVESTPSDKYVEGSIMEFWKRQGVVPILTTPRKEEEESFSWSEFINELGRSTQGKDRSGPE
jgi:hypothetical protein